MGWTGIYTDEPTADVIRREFTWSNENGSCRIVDMARVGTTYYAAVALAKKDNPVLIWGCVILTRREKGEVIIKEIGEECGPCETDCPERILNLLSPLPADDTTYAAKWRQSCRERLAERAKQNGAAKKVASGTVIKFAVPMKFTDGSTGDTFRVCQVGRRVTFMRLGDNGYVCGPYRITRWRQREYSIVNQEMEVAS